MAGSVPAAERPPHARAGNLAPWRRMLTVLAGVCLALGALWIVTVVAGPVDPITPNTVAPGLVLVLLAGVILNTVIQSLDRRSRPRESR